uniref:G-protein coupled receptors family 1 profile domain-containing protein n=1 Tax=Gopherus agassizii TaxID=38772 RepID=A0A452GXY0_9SAUR
DLPTIYTHSSATSLLIFLGLSISLFICLVGLVGNGMVLWFLGFPVKKEPFTIYILNLAIADFGFLLCMVAFLIIIILYLHMDFLVGFVVIEAIQWVALFIYNTGLYLLTDISIHRCLSVLYPIWYRCHIQKTCLPLCVLCSGAISTLFIKLYIVIMVTILFFLMFALPPRVIVLMAFLNHSMIHLFVMSLVILLPCMNSSINSFLYFLIGRHGKQQLREPLREVFQRIFNEKAGPQEKRPTKQVK